jgi:peptide/nickel transport system ATP-binding protein
VPLLSVNNLHVTLPTARGTVAALRGVSFDLDRGETLGLIGESGCGKSMTALALMGLLPEGAHVTGSMLFDGIELTTADEARWCELRGARLAMVFQEPMSALNPLHTIGHQIAEPLRLHRRLSRHAARAEALRLLDRVQMPQAAQRLDAYPHQLSGGQRQRVVIAIALACGPDLLVADEPTTALDVTLQREVLALLQELVRDTASHKDGAGMGLLLISHDLGVMADSVQRLMVMYAGTIVESGPTASVFQRLAHPYTQGLFAARPRLGLPRGTRLATIPGRVPDLIDLPAGCPFAERCPLVVAGCRVAPPPVVPVGPGHDVRCLRVLV